MPRDNRKHPAAHGPLAKIAISRSSDFIYAEFDPDEGDRLLEARGSTAIELFNHPDFDKKKFIVEQSELTYSNGKTKVFRSWFVTSHVMRDGVVVRKRFSFKCGTSLMHIREIWQFEKAAKNPGEAKKPLKDRGAIL